MSEPAAPPPPSRAAALKILATVVVIGGAVAILLTASISKGAEYYKFVDEVMSNTDSFRGKKLQVHGVVADGSIEQMRGTLMYRFKIKSRPDRPAANIVANYEGLVPDTFKSGAEVIVRGTLTADNQISVIPDGIMAKCPSKYNADEQAAQKQQAQQPSPGGDMAQKLKL